MSKHHNPLDILIDNIKTDMGLLEEKNSILQEAKEEQRVISVRLKEYKKDIQHMMKYLSPEQLAEIESLDLNISESSSGTKGELNPFSQIAVDSLLKAKGHNMTNGELYDAYVDSVPTESDALTYTQFNIKIRQLVNSGKISKKQLGDKPSRDDVVTLSMNAE